MLKIINLEEILNNHLSYSSAAPVGELNKHFIILAMKEACKQTLELAAEKINESIADLEYNSENKELQQSILNTINQIR